MTTHQSVQSAQESSGEIAELVGRYWDFLLAREPLLRVRRGLPVESLPGGSAEEAEERARFALDVLERVSALEAGGLSGPDADSAGFLAALAEQDVQAGRFHWLTPTATPYQLFNLSLYGDAVFRPFVFGDHSDVDRYLAVLHDLAASVGTIGDKVAGQAARGFRIPAPALPGAHATITALRASTARFVEVDDGRLAGLERASRSRLRDGVTRSVAAELEPAFDRLLAVIGDPAYLERAPGRVGWAQYEGGEEAYRSFVRTGTTSDTPPERLHELGLEHCRELAERMRAVRSALGFSGTESEFHQRLAGQSRLHARTPEDVEACYRSHLDRLSLQLPRWFATLPSAPYGLARLDPALEAGMTYGYYEQPTAGQPVGRYRYNGSDLSNRSLLGAASLIYHELAPGHHFHLARQAENETLPDLRREVAAFNAFNEGWAEYAAGLGWEMGLYDDPWEAYGRLTQERFTAARLVVDTGLNLGTMALDQARALMREHSTQSDVQTATDLLRYSSDLPGQALAYRAGYVEFRALRADAEARAGAGFDVRVFHDVVLDGGALPWPALRRRVARELGTDGRGPNG